MNRRIAIWAVCASLASTCLFAQSAPHGDSHKRTTFSATGLPPGISIDPQTGIISGSFDRSAIKDGKMTYDVMVKINGRNGGSGQTYVKIVVPNAPPTAIDDVATVGMAATSVINVLDNDRDADGDPLVITSAASEMAEILSFGGNEIVYRTAANAQKSDTVRYMVSDGHGGVATAKVRIIIGAAR